MLTWLKAIRQSDKLTANHNSYYALIICVPFKDHFNRNLKQCRDKGGGIRVPSQNNFLRMRKLSLKTRLLAKVGSTEYNAPRHFLKFVPFSCTPVFWLHFTRHFDWYSFSNLISSTLHLLKVKSVSYCLESLMHVFFLSSSPRSTLLA